MEITDLTVHELQEKLKNKEIEYEITSKHVPDVTKGKISLISEKN